VTLIRIKEENVEKGADVPTNTLGSYEEIGEAGYDHEAVGRSAKEHVRGQCHVNTIEHFWRHF
jgi:ISXO2-like transposase domain